MMLNALLLTAASLVMVYNTIIYEGITRAVAGCATILIIDLAIQAWRDYFDSKRGL